MTTPASGWTARWACLIVLLIAVTREIYTGVPDQAAREALGRLGEQLDS
jgi:hypothetical protein